MIEQLMDGFVQAATLTNLVFIFAGVAIGIVAGILPGIGSVTIIAVMIPITFSMSPVTAIAFLIGINKGGTSGGAIPAILLNAPGSPEAAASARDGYPLAKQGKARKAMKMALYSSVTGDFMSDMALILLAAPFAAIALQFQPVEITAIVIFSFTLIAALSSASLVRGIAAAALGVYLSMVGLDPVTAAPRLTFGLIELYDGISLTALAIGSLALSAIMAQYIDLARGAASGRPPVDPPPMTREGNRLSFAEYFSMVPTILRSSAIGTGVGMLPGLGVSLAAFLGYGAAKRFSKHPEKFGKGAIEGVAATEAANSAVVGSNLIPTIALGIPGNIVAALLIGAFMIHGVTPGPLMMEQHGALIYAIFASMLMANGVHLIVGRLGIPIWGEIAKVPKPIVLPIAALLCFAGVYAPTSSMFEVGQMIAFAILGYAMRKSGFSLVCFVVGFLLGPLLELSLRQSILLSGGDWSVFAERPIAVTFLVLTILAAWQFTRRPIKQPDGG